ncbi:uncharacterized protein [Drosophila pseudoobscura]|uniref:Uncharacterized protein isoform X1 n=1 Tax=Drosophila pseudoobscura pseudoobscura TaxID=46245 RepID=A0A6I8V3M8_DROPS|nr:uncharacterized protein LOC6898059 isoform X1 [Drosophila pseudoobscura]
MDLEIVEEHLLPPETNEETLMVQYDKEPARNQPEESESDYEFEELPAEECLQVQVVDADGYLKVLEKENSELKRDNLIMNLSIQTSERDTERLQRQLDKSNDLYGQLVTNLERIFSPAQIEKIQNDRRIVWPRADLIEAHNLYAASRSVCNILLRRNYPLPSVRTMQYWEARERNRTASAANQTAQRSATEQAMSHLLEVIDAINLVHNYT